MTYRKKSLTVIMLILASCFSLSPLEAGKKRTPRKATQVAAPRLDSHGNLSTPIDPLSVEPGAVAMRALQRAHQKAQPIPREWKGVKRLEGTLEPDGSMRLVPSEE